MENKFDFTLNFRDIEQDNKMLAEKIYEPVMVASDADRLELFSYESRAKKIQLYDIRLAKLRKESSLFDDLNNIKMLEETSSMENIKSNFTNVFEFLKDVKVLEKNSAMNFKSIENWFEKQKAEAHSESLIQCENYRKEFEEKKAKLKETLINEQLSEILNNQRLSVKSEIETKTKCETNNKPRSSKNEPQDTSLTIASNLSLVTTRSKKRLATSKLRPRLNGRASVVSPIDFKCDDKKRGRRGAKRTSGASHTKNVKLAQTPNTGNSGKKIKPNSIENKLKIKLSLEDEDISDDLKLLNTTW